MTLALATAITAFALGAWVGYGFGWNRGYSQRSREFDEEALKLRRED